MNVRIIRTMLIALLSLGIGVAVATQSAAAQSSGTTAISTCFDFEDLAANRYYVSEQSFFAAGQQIEVAALTTASGTELPVNLVEVKTHDAGNDDNGLELKLTNAQIVFDFAPVAFGEFALLFGDYGSGVLLDINGETRHATSFSELDGAEIAGVTVEVTAGSAANTGTLRLIGTLRTLALGGETLYLDDACGVQMAESNVNASSVAGQSVFQQLPLSNAVNQYCEQVIGQRSGLYPGSVSKLFGGFMKLGHEELQKITPPAEMEEIHATLTDGLADCAGAADYLEVGIVNLAQPELRRGLELMQSCAQSVADASEMMLEHGTPADGDDEQGNDDANNDDANNDDADDGDNEDGDEAVSPATMNDASG